MQYFINTSIASTVRTGSLHSDVCILTSDTDSEYTYDVQNICVTS
jgi:hypothetical protein